MNIYEFWWKNWKTIMDMPDWFLDKMLIALKYEMSYSDFIKMISNKYGCRFCGGIND